MTEAEFNQFRAALGTVNTLLSGVAGERWELRGNYPLPRPTDTITWLGRVDPKWQTYYSWVPGGKPITCFYASPFGAATGTTADVYMVPVETTGSAGVVWVTVTLGQLAPAGPVTGLDAALRSLRNDLNKQLEGILCELMKPSI